MCSRRSPSRRFGTELIAGEGMIATRGRHRQPYPLHLPAADRGGADVRRHHMIDRALGPRPARSPRLHARAVAHPADARGADAFPVNLASFSSKLRPCVASKRIQGRSGQTEAHEDWGTAGGDRQLPPPSRTRWTCRCDSHRCRHPTNRARRGRWPRQGPHDHTVTPKARGGHAPDIIKAASRTCCRPRPIRRGHTVNTIAEHLDMLMVRHHLDPAIAEDVAFAESRIRRETIAARTSCMTSAPSQMMSSDSQAMGRVGEVIIRTWQTAHKMKVQRGEPARTTMRGSPYVAKYTINPAIAHGISHEVGSLEGGKLADLVLWKPALFGVKPFLIVKGGNDRRGDGRPERLDPDAAAGSLSADVRREGRDVCVTGLPEKPLMKKLRKPLVAVRNTRKIGKKDMVHNDYLPEMSVRPGNLRGARRRRATRVRAGEGLADGTEVLPILKLTLPFEPDRRAACARRSTTARRWRSSCRAAGCCAAATASPRPTGASRDRGGAGEIAPYRVRGSLASPTTSATATYRSRSGRAFCASPKTMCSRDGAGSARVLRIEAPFEPESGAYGHRHEEMGHGGKIHDHHPR